jgi:2-amino-4-hydroxy-6-hydroxymethyldihydropteridine diphosphokinase
VHSQPHTAILSIGSNLGKKLDNCRRAIAALTALPQTAVVARSRFYKTAPVDYRDQDWFVNAAVKITTGLDARRLLTDLQRIERQIGRHGSGVRFGPRIIDIDIIFFDDAVTETTELCLPHPRLHKRRFVLQPICDIDPAIVHPALKRTVRAMLDDIDDPSQAVEPICCDC